MNVKEPLYVSIVRDLAQRIAAQEFNETGLLPTEMELCKEYQASRHTIRNALRELSDAGLISRKKRAGTRVEQPENTTAGKGHTMATLDDLVELAKHHLRVVKSIEPIVVDDELSALIGCAPGSKWLDILSIREDATRPDHPICLTHSYISAAYEEIGELIHHNPFALISDLIEQYYGQRSVEVRQTIKAVLIDEDDSAILSAPVGSPALKITRHYLDRSGKIFETTVSVHPADRYECSIVLKRTVSK